MIGYPLAEDKQLSFQSFQPFQPFHSLLFSALVRMDKKMVLYLLSRGLQFDNNDFRGAMQSARLSFMEWTLRKGCPISNPAILSLFEATFSLDRKAELLQWMMEHGSPIDAKVYRAFASSGRLDMLEALKKINAPCDATVHCFEPSYMNKECCKFLRENVCPLDESVFATFPNGAELYRLQKEFQFEPQSFSFGQTSYAFKW